MKSLKFGDLLVPFLITCLFLDLIFVFNSVIAVISLDLYVNYFSDFDWFLSYVYLFLLIFLFVLYLNWLYKVHLHIRSVDASYPITPLKSVLSFVIPIYNIYGIWNVLSRISGLLISFGGNKEKNGQKIAGYLPWCYGLFFFRYILNYYIFKYPENVSQLGIVLSNVADTLFTLIWLLIIKSIISGIFEKGTLTTVGQKEQIAP